MLPTPEPDRTGGSPSGGTPGERRAPGPRRRLSREGIVDAAIEIIEAHGLSGLSMRRLGDRLGVAPGTLYTYVTNRAALQTLILEALIARDDPPHELPGTWVEKLEALARQDWVDFREKPWVLELRQDEHDFGPASVAWLESALRIFDGTGLPAPVRMDIIETLDAYVRGAATIDVQSTGHAAELSRDLATESLQAYQETTALQQAVVTGAMPFSRSRFEFGLHCLLTGFQSIVEEERAKRAERDQGLGHTSQDS